MRESYFIPANDRKRTREMHYRAVCRQRRSNTGLMPETANQLFIRLTRNPRTIPVTRRN